MPLFLFILKNFSFSGFLALLHPIIIGAQRFSLHLQEKSAG